jgi:hypothetical protein
MQRFVFLAVNTMSIFANDNCPELAENTVRGMNLRDGAANFSQCSDEELEIMNGDLVNNITGYQQSIDPMVLQDSPEQQRLKLKFASRQAVLALIKMEIVSRK